MSNPKLIEIHELALRVSAPSAWLRAEAEAGRIPALQVGAKWMFDEQAVAAELARRARELPSQRRDLMTDREVEKWLGLKRGQAMKLAEAGELPAVGVAEGVIRFDPAEIEACMSRQDIGGALHNLSDAAKAVAMTPAALRELAEAGRVPCFTLAGSGRLVFDLSALRRTLLRAALAKQRGAAR